MPIYAYRCEACGFAKDVLQKMSDPELTVCTSCGQPAFKKQLTAAGFQLKGTGWYVTDFRGGSSSSAATSTTPNTNSDSSASESKPASTDGGNGGSGNAASSNASAASSTNSGTSGGTKTD
ncbi:MAG: zinc ribbon domain-containing protein [Burkholderiales bacterium]|nr:zinc ribbon domain-containing protein [Burkholderiales bacterium]